MAVLGVKLHPTSQGCRAYQAFACSGVHWARAPRLAGCVWHPKKGISTRQRAIDLRSDSLVQVIIWLWMLRKLRNEQSQKYVTPPSKGNRRIRAPNPDANSPNCFRPAGDSRHTLTLADRFDLRRTGPQSSSAVSVGATAERRGCNSFATRPVQPVWWEAPTPRPLSPWKYSWKST